MQLDGYIRVSRVGGREGESYITVEVQRDTITRWAASRGVTIAAWHIDEDVSGGTLRRPGLDAMMERIRSGVTGGVAVARLDRLSRAGVAEALKLVEEIREEHGAKIAAVDLGVDPTTPFGEFAMTVMLGLARMERRRVKDNWEVAQERAVARGVHVSSIAPTGYLRNAEGRLERHPEYAEPIGDLFRLRAAGRSWGELGEYLTAAGVVSAYGTGHWHGGSVQSIVRNRAYLGEARSGRFVNPDAHAPIIDRATWEAAQNVKGVRSPRSDEPALLSGLLRCAACRYRMKSNWQEGRGDRPRLRTYRCTRQTSGGTCPEPATVSCHLLDEYVERAFLMRSASWARCRTSPRRRSTP